MTAQHRIAAFPGGYQESRSAASLAARLRECGWHETRTAGAGQPSDIASPSAIPEDLHEYVLTDGPGADKRLLLARSDSWVAVLAVSTAAAYDHAHPDSRTDQCPDHVLLGDGATARPTDPAQHC